MVIGVINENGLGYNTNHLVGDIIIFISAVSWALYVILSSKIVKRLGGLTVTIWSMFSAAIMFILLQSIWPHSSCIPTYENYTQWLVILYVALIPTAAGFFLWFEAMSKIKLSLLNIMQYLTPVATIILAWIILGERMTFLNTVGALLTISGVMVASKIIKWKELNKQIKMFVEMKLQDRKIKEEIN